MNAFPVVVLWMMMSLAFLGGFGSRSARAQQSSGAGQSAEKLPPDIRPETLSRMPRTKKTDLTTDEEKQAFDRVVGHSAKQSVSRWLGPTGTRLAIPELADIYQKQINLIHAKSGLEPKYIELTVLVATRETNNKDEFLNHEPDALKLLPAKVVEIIKNNQDTKGLEEKEALIIQFGRELFREPKVSSKTFAAVERTFGRKTTLDIALFMCYYASNGLLMRAYDQQMDTSPTCVFPHSGCLNAKNPPRTW
jgi:4-carboxymuconolactone decarboxylase